MNKIRTVLFLSNFFNHHQKPFSDAMHARFGDGYFFLETCPMTQERKDLGWKQETLPAYVVSSEQLQSDFANFETQIFQADVVIFGSAPYKLIRRRIHAGKLTFRYSEHPLKNGPELHRYPDRFLRWHWLYPQNKQLYLLCASAYAAEDYRKFHLFKDRAYKWGYFPETLQYRDINALIHKKAHHSLIWAARYLDWKHPETALEIARRLKRDGYAFELVMIGNGQLLEQTTHTIRQEGLDDVVRIPGALSPEEVRKYMEQAQIHIFTSDHREGWGAVLNESMNSACVPVVNRDIGAAPFLIKDGENGYLYSGIDGLYQKVRYLLDHPRQREVMGKNAYTTITEEWNAESAAQRLVTLSEHLLTGSNISELYLEGPCSRA